MEPIAFIGWFGGVDNNPVRFCLLIVIVWRFSATLDKKPVITLGDPMVGSLGLEIQSSMHTVRL